MCSHSRLPFGSADGEASRSAWQNQAHQRWTRSFVFQLTRWAWVDGGGMVVVRENGEGRMGGGGGGGGLGGRSYKNCTDTPQMEIWVVGKGCKKKKHILCDCTEPSRQSRIIGCNFARLAARGERNCQERPTAPLPNTQSDMEQDPEGHGWWCVL